MHIRFGSELMFKSIRDWVHTVCLSIRKFSKCQIVIVNGCYYYFRLVKRFDELQCTQSKKKKKKYLTTRVFYLFYSSRTAE